MKNDCTCINDQSSLCGFDHINGDRRQDDCQLNTAIHNTKLNRDYRKVITREFPLQNTDRILASRFDPLTLVVQYDCSNKRNEVMSIKLKSYNKQSNLTTWHPLSFEDVDVFLRVFNTIKTDLSGEQNAEDIVLF